MISLDSFPKPNKERIYFPQRCRERRSLCPTFSRGSRGLSTNSLQRRINRRTTFNTSSDPRECEPTRSPSKTSITNTHETPASARYLYTSTWISQRKRARSLGRAEIGYGVFEEERLRQYQSVRILLGRQSQCRCLSIRGPLQERCDRASSYA